MKQEFLDKLYKIASSLDNAGLYEEASEIDKIASVNPVGFTANKSNQQVAPANNSFSVTGYYADHIKNYKNYVENNDAQGATNYFNAVMRSPMDPKQKGAFRAQAERIRSQYSVGEFANQGGSGISSDYINTILRKYGVTEPNLTKEVFDKRWTNMMTQAMYEKDNTGKMFKDNASWNQQMSLTYNILTQKYKR
jgi:hypothetical protein